MARPLVRKASRTPHTVTRPIWGRAVGLGEGSGGHLVQGGLLADEDEEDEAAPEEVDAADCPEDKLGAGETLGGLVVGVEEVVDALEHPEEAHHHKELGEEDLGTEVADHDARLVFLTSCSLVSWLILLGPELTARLLDFRVFCREFRALELLLLDLRTVRRILRLPHL